MSTSLHSLKMARKSHDVSPTSKASKLARVGFATDDELEAALDDLALDLETTKSKLTEMIVRAKVASKIDLRSLPHPLAIRLIRAVDHLAKDVKEFMSDGVFNAEEFLEYNLHRAEIDSIAREIFELRRRAS